MFQQIYRTALPFDDTESKNKELIREKKANDTFINEKSDLETVKFVISYIHEVVNAYYDDLTWKKYEFRIYQNNKQDIESENNDNEIDLFVLQFDIRNMLHLMALNAKSFANSSDECLFIKELCSQEPNFFNKLNFTLIQKLTEVLNKNKTQIIDYEDDRDPKLTKSLNWTKIAYKIFCILNIGNLGDDKNDIYFYMGIDGYETNFDSKSQKRKKPKYKLFMLKKTLSELYDDSYILLSFNITGDTSKPLDPESIKLVHINKDKMKYPIEIELRKYAGEIIDELKNVENLRQLRDTNIVRINIEQSSKEMRKNV